MRAALPYPAPRRQREPALLGVALFAAASGLLACEGRSPATRRARAATAPSQGRPAARAPRARPGARPCRPRPTLFGTCPSGGGEPGVSPLVKLSTIQYRNTVRDLLGASGLSAVATEVAPMLAAIPDDSTVAFRGLDARISSDHIQGYFNVATAVADAATNTSQRLTSARGQLRRDVAAGGELPGRVPRVVRQARLPPPARRRRDRADEGRRDGDLARARPTPPRRSATSSSCC